MSFPLFWQKVCAGVQELKSTPALVRVFKERITCASHCGSRKITNLMNIALPVVDEMARRVANRVRTGENHHLIPGQSMVRKQLRELIHGI